jgi:hypothetical protein
LAVAVAMFLVARAWHDRTIASFAPPTFDIQDRQGAVWTVETVGATARVQLSAGSASFRVRRTTERQRFLLSLPDGEIEVHGTRFVVELAAGATRHVEVSEGVVTLRMRGAEPREIGAGERWDQPASPVDPPAPLQGPPPDEAAGGADARSHGQHPIADRHESPHEEPFGAGVAAFRAGDFRRAERLLDRFLSSPTSSGDPRIEDACFLRAVARSRSGDTEGAAKLARDYLRRFPNGLRRPEAERMAAEH